MVIVIVKHVIKDYPTESNGGHKNDKTGGLVNYLSLREYSILYFLAWNLHYVSLSRLGSKPIKSTFESPLLKHGIQGYLAF